MIAKRIATIAKAKSKKAATMATEISVAILQEISKKMALRKAEITETIMPGIKTRARVVKIKRNVAQRISAHAITTSVVAALALKKRMQIKSKRHKLQG